MDFDINNFVFTCSAIDREIPEEKTEMELCCAATVKVFDGLVPHNPTRDEFELFRSSFVQHPFANKDALQNRLPEMIEEIFERATLFGLDLRTYFLDSMIEDVMLKLEGNMRMVKEKMMFSQLFGARRKDLETAPAEKEVSEQGRKGGWTLARQIHAIHFLLNEAGLDWNTVPRTEVARLTQLLTGRELGSADITHTTIYQRWWKIYGENQQKNRQDLEAVKAIFEQLGLYKIATKIESEIKNS